MRRLQKAAIVIELAQSLQEAKSWCGETHLQKGMYFLQELFRVPTGFEFVLYKYGPFSFDLRDELTALRADGLLKLAFQAPPYGPSIAPTDQGKRLRERFPRTLGEHRGHIRFVAEMFGPSRVAHLERLATALYVTRKSGATASVEERARELTRLKPHVPCSMAAASVEELDEILAEATRTG